MDPVIALAVGIGGGLVVGALIGWLFGKLMSARRGGNDPEILRARHEVELAELKTLEQEAQAALSSELAGVQATANALRDQVQSMQNQHQELLDRQKSEQLAQLERERAESKVLQMLTPVQENLRTMQSKVADLETQRQQQHGELTQQLKSAAESEERLRSTAESLAAALKSNSTRGVWGETQLRNVVEAAGLLERVDFDVQESIASDAGSGRPDMVVHLPGGKNIAVDAKVPFNSYLEASAIPATAVGEEAARRERLLKQHVKALRAHIDALAAREYFAGLDSSPEMVIAFIPSESLVSSAMEADPGIMDYAFGKRVALASPVSLWSVLRTVSYTWQQNVLTEDAKLLFDLSRELYGRLSKLSEHVEKLGRSIERSVKDYNAFVGSLERNVLPSARKLSALDESKVLGTIDGIEESPRQLTAFELTNEED
ncbi:MAG: DNA recombination protein RmuC [Microbacteriaceae bacterium]|nr:DNA recombination protein RmuC [Cryobacterium sp.]MCC6376303.1 DNA recombination protein RmuC [Microbacteriaceae bacterium]